MKANVAVAWVVAACLGLESAQAADVLASRYDNQRTGANLEETILTTANVHRDHFRLLFDYDVKDDVYAQPLFVSDLDIPSRGRRNVVFVVNVNNDVFAFDADGRLGEESDVLWTRNLGTPEKIDDFIRNGGDGNVRKGGNLGIMGTPVIDRERGILFLVSRQKVANPDRRTRYADPFKLVQKLYALDIKTGLDKAGSPIEIEASKGSIAFNPRIQNQRAGLALSRGHLVIAWGSHQDEAAYVGWVMSYRYARNRFTQTGVLVTTPAGVLGAPRAPAPLAYFCLGSSCAQGGVWQTGRAPAVDSRGMILLFVGNGHNNTNDPRRNFSNTSFGNSFLRLNPETLAVFDFFTPSYFYFLNFYDLDLGGSGPMIIPGSAFESVVGGGKEGRMYVWNLAGPPVPGNESQLGRFTPDDSGLAQHFFAGNRILYELHERIPIWDITIPDIPLPVGDGVETPDVRTHVTRAGHIMGGPVYWNGPNGGVLYNWSEDSELRAYPVDPSSRTPITVRPTLASNAPRIVDGRDGGTLKGHPGGILSLSANGSQPGSGIVWASTFDPGEDLLEGALHKLKPGVLRAFDAQDITQELWNSEESDGDRLGTLAKFNPPTVANGRVYMAAFGADGSPAFGKLKVYGLQNHQYLRPAEAEQQRNAARWWQTMAPVRKP